MCIEQGFVGAEGAREDFNGGNTGRLIWSVVVKVGCVGDSQGPESVVIDIGPVQSAKQRGSSSFLLW